MRAGTLARADDGEVSKVEDSDGRLSQPFSGRDDGRVDAAEAQVPVLLDKLRHAFPVRASHGLHGKLALGDGAVEGRVGSRPELPVRSGMPPRPRPAWER